MREDEGKQGRSPMTENTGDEGQRGRMKANGGGQGRTSANEGGQGPTREDEGDED